VSTPETEVSDKPSLMTAGEVAGLLGVRTNTVYAWANGGLIPCYRIRRLLRFDRAEIRSWLAEHGSHGAASRAAAACEHVL
jgi:excisionase family DNA binding protein